MMRGELEGQRRKNECIERRLGIRRYASFCLKKECTKRIIGVLEFEKPENM